MNQEKLNLRLSEVAMGYHKGDLRIVSILFGVTFLLLNYFLFPSNYQNVLYMRLVIITLLVGFGLFVQAILMYQLSIKKELLKWGQLPCNYITGSGETGRLVLLFVGLGFLTFYVEIATLLLANGLFVECFAWVIINVPITLYLLIKLLYLQYESSL